MSLEIGTIVTGKVVSILPFGAFVEIEKGKTGLVHISEIASDYVKDIGDYLKVGDSVRVKLISIDPKGKISLSIKKAAALFTGTAAFIPLVSILLRCRRFPWPPGISPGSWSGSALLSRN